MTRGGHRSNLDDIAEKYRKDSAEILLAKHFLSHRKTLPLHIIAMATPDQVLSGLNFGGSLALPSNNLLTKSLPDKCDPNDPDPLLTATIAKMKASYPDKVTQTKKRKRLQPSIETPIKQPNIDSTNLALPVPDTVLLVPPEFVTTLVNHTNAILQYAAMIPDYIAALNAHTNALKANANISTRANANTPTQATANTSIRANANTSSTPTIVLRRNKKTKNVVLSTPSTDDFWHSNAE
ncbi:uncharacterized protein UV8b_05136 [Ustilaginoidea virens]|uniref:Uncharacterized protein n=1 Tax=Ustilaginoidea virens TaxID=1159556 RepID=A0A8E5HT48_USTVR|nr:uncharacterized protein UV8b_05136 [Ustilaginoidea virens]QUC20895.1 hypothetical protein UV8b_05136 [Ustilaginoidea virens]